MPRENTTRNTADPKKRKKLALGRGLDALIPDYDPEQDNPRDYFLCDVDLIRPNRYQPRQHFSDDDLEELGNSIKSQGIIQPLLVRRIDHGYELVAGERRLRAARKVGLTKVPVVYRDVSDAELLEISIVENIQREDFNPIEEAEAYHRLITEFKLTQDQAAERVGKSRSAVANFLRLRNLPQQIKDSIVEGSLSMGHARSLLGVDKKTAQVDIWRKVMSRGLSVRETESLVRQLRVAGAPRRSPPSSSEDVYFSDVTADLSRHFGTKVNIKRRGKVGKLEIEFYSDDDLDRLLRQLKG
jgi:ParB family transcriptional regulator, chromosome partitioning protein